LFIQNIPDSVVRYELKQLHKELPGIVLQVLSGILQQTTFTFARGTVLPTTVPSEVAFFVLNRQALGLGDIFYMSLQRSHAQWEWHQVIKAT